jgi:hypothetical protein
MTAVLDLNAQFTAKRFEHDLVTSTLQGWVYRFAIQAIHVYVKIWTKRTFQ